MYAVVQCYRSTSLFTKNGDIADFDHTYGGQACGILRFPPIPGSVNESYTPIPTMIYARGWRAVGSVYAYQL